MTERAPKQRALKTCYTEGLSLREGPFPFITCSLFSCPGFLEMLVMKGKPLTPVTQVTVPLPSTPNTPRDTSHTPPTLTWLLGSFPMCLLTIFKAFSNSPFLMQTITAYRKKMPVSLLTSNRPYTRHQPGKRMYNNQEQHTGTSLAPAHTEQQHVR